MGNYQKAAITNARVLKKTCIPRAFNIDFFALRCASTKLSKYFNARTRTPFADFGIQPTVMLADSDTQQIKEIIHRGIQFDGPFPKGTAYLTSATDVARNLQSIGYESITAFLPDQIKIEKRECAAYC